MSYNKIVTLVHRLSRGTMDGHIAWQETENPKAFAAVFSGYRLAIEEEKRPCLQGGKPLTDHVVRIHDADGRIVEEFSDEDLSPLVINAGALLREIYVDARRKVRGIDQALESILAELPDDECQETQMHKRSAV